MRSDKKAVWTVMKIRWFFDIPFSGRITHMQLDAALCTRHTKRGLFVYSVHPNGRTDCEPVKGT